MKNKKTTKPGMQSYAVGDPIAAYYAEVAESYLPAWMRNLREIRAGWDARVESKGGAAPPVELLNHSVVAVRTYPASMGLIGMDHRAVREVRSVALARATLDQLTTSAGVALAHEAHRQGMDVAAVDGGLRALRLAYAPNPNGDGTESGVEYPADCLWPECMSVSDRAKLDADVRGRLDSFAAALDRLNHSTGRVAAAVNAAQCPDEDDDFIFRRDGGLGGYWTIRYDGMDLPHVPASKGMVQIHRLLSKRMDPVPARDLHYISEHVHPDAIKDNSGALADTHGTEWSREFVYADPGAARKAMQGRLADIDAEMAEPSTPLETRDELQVEQAKLTKAIREIGATMKIGGPQVARDDKRTAVKGTIDRAIAMIGKTTRCDELARHLTNMIETGTTCIYKGDHDWLTE